MKDYRDTYTEEISKAAVYRKGYLDSVKSLTDLVAVENANKREDYFSREKLIKNRGFYLESFKRMLGDPLFDRRKGCSLQKIFVSCDSQGYIYRLVFSFEKGIKFYGMLFVPFDAKEKLPLVVALHGGDGTPELISDIYGQNYYSHITRRLLDRKVAVFAPQLLIWDGKRFGNRFDRFETDARFKALGSSLASFECECMMGALDELLTADFVDGSSVGVTGLSYGGYYSLVLAALDERIKAVYSSCVFNDRIKYSRPDFTYFNMSESFLDAETAALIYPRALYIEAGKNDGFFSPDGAVREYDRLKGFYADRPEKLVFKLTDTGHKYDDTDEGIDFLLSNI